MNRRHEFKGPPRSRTSDISETPDTIGGDVFVGIVGKLGKDALRYFPAVILPAILGFVGVAIFTRIFPPGPYGQYSIVFATAMIAIGVLGGWLQQSTLRYLPRYREQGKLDVFKNQLHVVLLIEVIVVTVLALAGYFVVRGSAGEYARFYLPGAILVIVWVLFSVYNSAFQANLQAERYARYQVLQALGKLLFALAFVFFVSRDVVGLVVGVALACGVLVVPMAGQLGVLNVLRKGAWSVDTKLVRSFFSYGLPVVGWLLFVKLLALSGRFIIEIYRDSDEVGIYAANYNLAATFIAFVAGPILLAAHPLIINAWEGGKKARIQEIITTFSRYFLLVAIPIGVFICVFARQIVTILLGEEFREGFIIMPFVVAGMVVWSFAMYGHKGIKLREKTNIMLNLIIICAVVNVGFSLLLVPMYGYVGAAVATLIAYWLYPVMVFWITKRYLPWSIPWKSVARILGASGACLVFWWPSSRASTESLQGWVWCAAGGVAGFLLYVAMLYLLGELRDYEKQSLKARMGRFGRKTVH